jgi:hypothetical protein
MPRIDRSAKSLGDFVRRVGQTSTESEQRSASTSPLQRPHIAHLWEKNLEKHITM